MSKNEKIFGLIVILGFLVGIIVIYLTISSTIYKIKNDTEQIIKDHRTMVCTITEVRKGKTAIVRSPMELDLEYESTSL